MDTTDLLTLRQMAKTVRVSVTWLRGETLAGRIPVLKAGRRLYFNPAAVNKVLIERAGLTLAPEGEQNAR